MSGKTTTFSDQTSRRRQRLRSVGFSGTQPKPERKSEFDPWQLVKRSCVNSAYSLVLKYRSTVYSAVPTVRRSRSITPAPVVRRRKNTESAMTSESDGRSSVQSNMTELEGEANSKEEYDYDAEEVPEPPQYPHLVHKPGTYSQELYLKVCKEYRISASKHFYKQLTEEKVILRRQGLGPLGMKACAVALMEILKVHTLDLTDNNIGPKGAKYLAELLLENQFIKHLIISDNNLGYTGVHLLAETLKSTDSLVSLDISGNGLGDKQAEAVRPIIEDTNNLKCLNLSHNELREDGGQIIGDALFWSDTIQNLDLSWNHLRRGGVVAIGEALMKNSSLLVLNLSWNGLYTLECAALSKSLEKNSTLTELDLSYNRINRKCLDLLIISLKKNTALKTLKLGHNPLLPGDALALLIFIRDNTSTGLMQLDLEDILVEQPFLDLLESVRKVRNITITHGKLRGPDMTVYDYDEGVLLKEEPWTVIVELGNIIGIDYFTIFTEISDELQTFLTPEQVIAALKILLNPLSDRCTRILVSRLEMNSKGFIDFRHISELHAKRLVSTSPKKQKSEFDLIQYMTQSDYDVHHYNDRREDDSENTVQRIRQCLYHVMTRKLCGSTEYRRDVEWNSQYGGEVLKYRIVEQYQLSKFGPDGRKVEVGADNGRS